MANRISVSTKKLHFVSDMIRCAPFSWSVLCSPFVSICLTLWSTPLCLPDTMTLHFVHLPDTMMYSSVPDTDVLYSILSVCLTPWCTILYVCLTLWCTPICLYAWHYDVLHSVCLSDTLFCLSAWHYDVLHFVCLPDTMMYAILYSCLTPWCTPFRLYAWHRTPFCLSAWHCTPFCLPAWHYDVLHSVQLSDTLMYSNLSVCLTL